MHPLAGIVLLLILTIVIGKRTERVNVRSYLIVLLIAILQVCVVVFYMFTAEPPNVVKE